MFLIIVEPKEEVKKWKEERYLSDRIFFNYVLAEEFAKEQMKLHPIKTYIAEVQTPFLTVVDEEKKS